MLLMVNTSEHTFPKTPMKVSGHTLKGFNYLIKAEVPKSEKLHSLGSNIKAFISHITITNSHCTSVLSTAGTHATALTVDQ